MRDRDVAFLDYADTAEAAFQSAGGRWAGSAGHMRRLINIFLCLSQLGSNAVYILFVAQNILPVISCTALHIGIVPKAKSRLYLEISFHFCRLWSTTFNWVGITGFT